VNKVLYYPLTMKYRPEKGGNKIFYGALPFEEKREQTTFSPGHSEMNGQENCLFPLFSRDWKELALLMWKQRSAD